MLTSLPEVLQMLCWRLKEFWWSVSKQQGHDGDPAEISGGPCDRPSPQGALFLAWLQRMLLAFSWGCDQWPRWAETQRGVKDLLTSCERQATGGSESLERHRNWALVVGVFVCIRTLWVVPPADSLNGTDPAELQLSDAGNHTETLLTYAGVTREVTCVPL